jgi:glucuronosyltransferase
LGLLLKPNVSQIPLILASSSGGFHYANYAVGNPFNTAYVPIIVLDQTNIKTFWERLMSTLFIWYWDLGAEIYYLPAQNRLKEELFGPGVPSVQTLRQTASLVLVNNHFTLNYPRPLVPAFVEVGGMHLKPSEGQLPISMKKWIDEAKEGVIYFSLGSNIRSDTMPEEKRNEFLAAFAEIKQRVIWKWESEEMPGKPDNVLITKWAPQMDILGSNFIRFFIQTIY